MVETYDRKNTMLSFYNMLRDVFHKKRYVIHQNVLNYKERRSLRRFQ